MTGSSFRAPLAAAALLLLASCDDLPLQPPEESGAVCLAPAAAEAAAESLPLDPLFAAAAAEFDVPAALLKAIGWVETRWQMVEGHPEFPGQPAAFGVMGLREGQVPLAARLAGVTEAEARTGAEANIRAAAALLRHLAADLPELPRDLGGWAPAVARYSTITLPAGQAAYVHDDVFGVLRTGAERVGVAGLPSARLEAVASPLDPRGVPSRQLSSASTSSAAADQAGAVWRGSPNFNARPAGDIGRVAMVIIHSCEGSYTGCWSWLANPDSRVSAHYVVREDGSEITQMVREADRGWHIGSTYDCSRNARWECWRNGQSNNHFTIGVEHAGYASQTVWSAAQLDASARLVCDVTRRHGIGRDHIRIVGHAQLQPHDRTDPGRNWPWAHYLSRIDAHCGGGGAAGEVVVDAALASNDPARGYITLSGSWTATRATPGFYGNGYHFASTGPDPDPATFHFFLAEPATRTVDAWWTAGSNRSPRATFVARDGAGRTLGTARVDQQAAGSRWNSLGSWSFPAGWNSIQLSREGARGCVVIADAIRVR